MLWFGTGEEILGVLHRPSNERRQIEICYPIYMRMGIRIVSYLTVSHQIHDTAFGMCLLICVEVLEDVTRPSVVVVSDVRITARPWFKALHDYIHV